MSRSAGALLLAGRLETLLRVSAAGSSAPMHPNARATSAIVAADAGDAGAATSTPLPDYVGHALARWRLLHDVPFRYLVPDARLLPMESIRFFTLDGAWLDALAAGALAMGGAGTRDMARSRVMFSAARQAADAHQRSVRDVARGRITLDGLARTTGSRVAADVVSGFILRSGLVSGWPGMQLRAWASDDPAQVPPQADPAVLEAADPALVVPILRLERLSPSVLLALFAGVPRLLWIEEPHHGVQYGVQVAAGGPTVALRNEAGQDVGPQIPVPMRAGPGSVPSVVNVSQLAHALDTARPLAAPRGSAALALSLLQAPARQRFSTTAGPAPAPTHRSRAT